ncbi:unnamed protein product, partial [marine sediment metagenome]
ALLIEKLGIDFAELGEQMEAGRWPDARARLAAAFRTRTRDEWAAMFETTDACVSPVLDWDEAIAHPHNRARNSFVEIEGVPQPAPVPRFSRTPPSVSRPPSAADQHTEAILSEWGLSQSDLVALRECEAI